MAGQSGSGRYAPYQHAHPATVKERRTGGIFGVPPQVPVQALGNREKGTGKGYHVRTAPDRRLQEEPVVGRDKGYRQ